MNPLDDLEESTIQKLLVIFYDIKGFASIARKISNPLDGFRLIEGMSNIAIDTLQASGGTLIKFIGDSALIVYPEDLLDDGVMTMLDLKQDLESYLAQNGFDSKLVFGLHFGEVAIGPFGKTPYRRLDVMGDGVQQAAIVADGRQKSNFVVTPQLFRSLQPETRKHFHKFTPPIVYTAENA